MEYLIVIIIFGLCALAMNIGLIFKNKPLKKHVETLRMDVKFVAVNQIVVKVIFNS